MRRAPNVVVFIAAAALLAAPSVAHASEARLTLRVEPEGERNDDGAELYRVLTHRGDALSQRHFAELVGDPGDVAAIEQRIDDHRSRGTWLAIGAGVATVGGMSVALWASELPSGSRHATFGAVFFGGLALGAALGVFAYRDYAWLVENEESVVATDPFYALEDARGRCARFNAGERPRAADAPRPERTTDAARDTRLPAAAVRLGWSF